MMLSHDQIEALSGRGFTVSSWGHLDRYSGADRVVLIPPEVACIGFGAFSNCKHVEKVVIPGTVSGIEFGAFANCRSLQGVEIGTGVKTIDDSAFQNCEGIRFIEFPGSVTAIDINTFAGCGGLQFVRISQGVRRIRMFAFSGCDGLHSVEIPDSVQTIDRRAFWQSSALQTVICSEQTWAKFRVLFAAHVRRVEVSKAVVIQKGSRLAVFEKLPFMGTQPNLLSQDLVRQNLLRNQNRRQLRDLGIGDAWKELMRMNLFFMTERQPKLHVPREMWSRIFCFLFAMNCSGSKVSDGLALIRGISGESRDDKLRELADEDRQIPHNQRLFDARFGIQRVGSGVFGGSQSTTAPQVSKGHTPHPRGRS